MNIRFINNSFLTLVILISSCDPGIEPGKGGLKSSPKLIKESHYVYGTDELLTAINYDYNEGGKLLAETAIDIRSNSTHIKRYEYNSLGQLEQLIFESPDGYTFAITYTYENGVKKIEDKEESTGIYRQVFHYTNLTLDSVEHYSINPEMEPNLAYTHHYTYKNGLLAKESFSVIIDALNVGPKMLSWDGTYYTYVNGLLQSKCDGEVECTKYVYNTKDKVIRITKNDGSEERLLEELTYESDRLTEKTLYHYSAYSGDDFIDKTTVRYAYGTQ
jgi:hypothetical protein